MVDLSQESKVNTLCGFPDAFFEPGSFSSGVSCDLFTLPSDSYGSGRRPQNERKLLLERPKKPHFHDSSREGGGAKMDDECVIHVGGLRVVFEVKDHRYLMMLLGRDATM